MTQRQRHLCLSRYSTEQIVKIVSNAASQRAHALQLLPGEALFLGAPLIGHVLCCSHGADYCAVIVSDCFEDRMRMPHLTVWPDDSKFYMNRCITRMYSFVGFQKFLLVLGVNIAQENRKAGWSIVPQPVNPKHFI